MGDINTLKNILLFAVRNDCKEIHLSAGRLPLLVDGNGQTRYLNGIMPVDSSTMSEIEKSYISGGGNVITSIGDEEFLLMKLGSELVFRHLCFVEPPKDVSGTFSSACYGTKGLILVVSRSGEQRSLNAYSTASYIAANRNITIAIIEKHKSFKLKEYGSRIINIYNPSVELDVLLGITSQLSYDCLLVPDCLDEQSLATLASLSVDKLVVAGTTPELARSADKKKVTHIINVVENGTVSSKLDTELKINRELIIQNLRG